MRPLLAVLCLALGVTFLAIRMPGPTRAGEGPGEPASTGAVTSTPPSSRKTPSPPATDPATGKGPWVVRAHYADRRMVDEMAAWVEPWEVVQRAQPGGELGYVVVSVDRAGVRRLLDAGFRVEVDELLTTRLAQPNAPLPGQTTGIDGYPCYRTVEETLAAAQAIAATHPALATWVDAGDSWEKESRGEGYDLTVLRLTHSVVPGPKPRLFVTSSMHAREYAPAELNTRFGEYLVEQYGVDPDVTWLLDEHEIHLLLQANPDGRKWAEAGLLWRKNSNNDYCSNTNWRGADLNRNFAFEWACCGGSSIGECDETYRGAGAASEPETRAIQAYLRTLFPDQRGEGPDAAAPITATGVFLDLHSYGELVLWPWGSRSTPPPNGAGLQTLGRKFAYLNGYRPDQADGLYRTDGTADSFAYGELGLAGYTFELGTSFFQSCSVFEDHIVAENLAALVYAAKVVRVPYQTPAGPDVLGVSVSRAIVRAGESVTLTAVADDTRYSDRNGIEPSQRIAAAEYYLDVPPWRTGAGPIAHPLAAADGSFDQTAEALEATVETTGLNVGRHLVLVRSQDGDGNWGAFSAVFLHVVDVYAVYLPVCARGAAP